MLSVVMRMAPVLIAVIGASPAQAGSGPALACSPAFDSSQSVWAAADFDGDNAVDLVRVRVRRVGTNIVASGVDRFAFCKNSVPPIFNSFAEVGLVLSARDIDADHDQDLVLRDPFGGEALGVWLNDGRGGFSETDPSAFPGAADDPSGLQKRFWRIDRSVASPSSKHCASVPRRAGAARIAPGRARGSVESPAHLISGEREALQIRGPPFLSF